jgi:hypothetical protein
LKKHRVLPPIVSYCYAPSISSVTHHPIPWIYIVRAGTNA